LKLNEKTIETAKQVEEQFREAEERRNQEAMEQNLKELKKIVM